VRRVTGTEARLAGVPRAAREGAGAGVGQGFAQQPGEPGGAVEGEVQAVGLEPARVAPAVGDPVEQQGALGVAFGAGTDGVGVAAGAAAQLQRGDQADHALAAGDVEGLVDLPGGDARVGAERDHDQVRQLVLALGFLDQAEALFHLATAVGVDQVALVGEGGEGEQHGRVADRQRRVSAGVHPHLRLADLDPAAGPAGLSPRRRQHRREQGSRADNGRDLESATHRIRSISIARLRGRRPPAT
jgi:hypothetical protein